eukprot:gene7531-11855_t
MNIRFSEENLKIIKDEVKKRTIILNKTTMVNDVILKNKKKFTKNFAKYVNNEFCSDIKFILKDNEICYGHDFVISQYIKTKYIMEFPNLTRKNFINGLYFLYTGEIDEKLEVIELIELLDFSAYFYLKNLKDMIYLSISKYSDELLNSNSFLNLHEDVLMTLLFSDNFPIGDEFELLKRIIEWGEYNSKLDLDIFFEGIRFTRIDPKNLLSIEEKIPKKFLIQTFKNLIKNEIERPRGGPKKFEYEFDFDEKGILYYIGTNELQNEWENPVLNNIETEIDVLFSPLSVDVMGNISSFVGRTKSDLWLKTFSDSSFILDLGESRKVLISKYTIRHFSQSCCFLKSWNLEASNDNENWIILQEYKYSLSLFDKPNQTKTFSVDKVSTFFRYFKIHQTAENSSNWNFGIGGFELYGKLIEE